jgi:hypothetical protein
MRIAGFALDTTTPMELSTSAAATEVSLPSGRSHHVMRLEGPMHLDWKSQLKRIGVFFHQSLGEDQYPGRIESTKVDDIPDDCDDLETLRKIWKCKRTACVFHEDHCLCSAKAD